MGRSTENKTILRQHSNSSNTNSTASPKGRLNSLFKKWPSNSGSSGASAHREGSGSSEKIAETTHSERILNSSFQHLPGLELSRSIPSPDSLTGASHDPELQHLRENIQSLRKAPSGSDPKRVDAVWEIYRRQREESLQLCSNLLQKAQNNGRNSSLDSSNIGPFDTRASFSGSLLEPSQPLHINEQWLKTINEYKLTQEFMLDDLRNSLLATYKAYEPESSERHRDLFLKDKLMRKSLIIKWRDTSVHRMKSEKPLFWEQFKMRTQNYDKLILDLQAVEKLFDIADVEESLDMPIREYVIAKTGDTILEFANIASELYPVLRFRVSSVYLAEASPLFAQIFSSQSGASPPLDMISHLPPPPTQYICNDSMEVKVYRMPQTEPNKDESLTILLNAAHMHKPGVPHMIDFPLFVSIAEVCLRYRCTAPLEIYVEYIWLKQWEKKIADEKDDGLLLISYTFGMQGIFTRMSKSAILNAVDDDEIQSKEHWPQSVRDRIKHTRAAKIAQIRECCANAMQEYFPAPSETAERPSGTGSLQMTTTPRCPRGSHQCDATNLGWLMLVFNELQVLPTLVNADDFPHLSRPPKRSLKELIDCMRLMPSAPQVHSGICDNAPAFRSAINDISNSVSGLTLRDVSGRDGWALSKNAQLDETYGFGSMVELPGSLEPQEDRLPTALSNQDISLRILYHIDNLEDLNSAAMIDRTFYNAYKRNEAELLKNVMKAERKRTLSSQTVVGLVKSKSRGRRTKKQDGPEKGQRNNSITEEPANEKFRIEGSSTTPPPPFEDSGGDDLYDSTSPPSPVTYGGVTMSEEEARRILWGDDDSTNQQEPSKTNGQALDRNEKYLLGDINHTDMEGKARLADGEKHLRDEMEMTLGRGIRKK